MSWVRAAIWSLSIGVLSVLLASVGVRFLPFPLAVLAIGVALVSGAIALVAEISPRIGAAGGACAAVLVAAVLGFTLAAAPLEPGAHRPELRDLFWKPLFLLLGTVALCTVTGWLSTRATLRLTRRRSL